MYEETHILGVGSLGLHDFGNLYRLQAQIGKKTRRYKG